MEYSHNKGRPNIRELKASMRAELEVRRRAISPEEKRELDDAICRRLSSLISIRYASEILSFSPRPEEVGIGQFNRQMAESKKDFYLPRCVPGTAEMNFRLVKSLDELEKGAFSIMEPPESALAWKNEPGKNAVCIIPAIAYDPDGYRLGYGKGYYDRYLSSKDVLKIGVAYTQFLVDQVPRGRYDLSVDIIVTEKSVLTVKNGRK